MAARELQAVARAKPAVGICTDEGEVRKTRKNVALLSSPYSVPRSAQSHSPSRPPMYSLKTDDPQHLTQPFRGVKWTAVSNHARVLWHNLPSITCEYGLARLFFVFPKTTYSFHEWLAGVVGLTKSSRGCV